jgi:steroid delta-isomerase-like uncharacterized protein
VPSKPAETNRNAAVRLYRETFGNRNLAVADELLAANFVFHNAGLEIQGLDGWKAFAEGWLDGFPDLDISVDFSIADDERVLLHWKGHGTHGGRFRGVPATERIVSVSGLTLFRFAFGKIEEMWDQVAAFGEFQSLRVS